MKNKLSGGEDLVNAELTGPGRVWRLTWYVGRGQHQKEAWPLLKELWGWFGF